MSARTCTIATVSIVCCLCSRSAPAAEYRLLCGLNDLEGVTQTWGETLTEKEMRLSAEPERMSEGAASLLIRGLASDHKGNQYFGARIQIPATDLEAKRLRFDAWTSTPQSTNAIYVRYYNPRREIVGSWSNWSSPFRQTSSQTFSLRTGASRKGFQYETGVVSGSPCTDVVAIEILMGTREKNVPFDLYVDNLRVSVKQVASALDLKTPKKLYLQTTLVKSGKPNAVIVPPDDPEHRTVAARVVDKIKALSGATLPIADRLSLAELAKTNVILLGNVNTNACVAPLYAHYYTAADAVYPGPGGYVVRTVHDPWGTGVNAVVLAGAGADEVAQAAAALLKQLRASRTLVVPPTLEVKLGLDPTGSLAALKSTPSADYVERRFKAARSALDRGAHGGITGMVAAAGLTYARTGHQAYAEEFKRLVYLMYEHVLSKPKTYGGPWGMDADFRLYSMMPAWDLVEESPVFSDDDRLKITAIYAEFIQSCLRGARSVLANKRVRHNHETFPSLGLLYAGMYFQKYYAAEEADYWLEIADECFRVQSLGAKPYEDCNGYQWLTGYHTLKYALARPDSSFFHNSNARRLADFGVLCMDNLGYQVPYGDTGSYQCWWSELPYLRGTAWFTGDMRYQWALHKKAKARPRTGINEHAQAGVGIEPVDLLGTRAFPVDQRYYEAWGGSSVPRSAAVDKVVMRDSFDPDKQYLLLDGLSNGGHKHYDGNSISRITDRGRIWLADNDYIKSLPKYHNGVLIFRDGQSAKIPDYCELENIADFDTLGFSETVLRDYAGVHWHRNIIWAKEQYFLVVDEMEAAEDSDFSFRTVWQTVGTAHLADDGLEVEQKGKRFFIRQAPGPRMRLYDDPALGKNWAGYAYAKPVVRVFQQIAGARLKKGDAYRFFNLLHCSDDERPLVLHVDRLSESCVAVRPGTGPDGLALVGVGSASSVQALMPDAQVAAAMFHIDDRGYALVGATRLDWRGQRFVADNPVNVHARAGRAAVVAGQPTRVELLVSEGEPRVDGQVEKVERRGDLLVLHGLCGKCEITGVNSSLDDFAPAVRRAIENAPRVAAGPQAGEASQPPLLKQFWSLKEKLPEFLLTNNTGYFEAIDTGFAVMCDHAPLEANVFSSAADGSNNLDSLTDGILRTTQGCVMWDTGQEVTLSFDLRDTYELSRIKIKAWWADSSSKNKTYQLHRAVVEASSDGFAKDRRRLGEIADTETHGNWGAPGYGPHDYELSVPKVAARYLRISLAPKEGTGIYIAELEIWGNKEGLEIDVATQLKRGLPVHTFVALDSCDVDGDGREEIIAGSTNGRAYLIGSDGAVRWTFEAGGQVHAVSTATFEPGKRAIVCGSANGQVRALAPDGRELWAFDIPYYKRTPVVRTIFPADLDGDGRQEVVAGAENWHYYAFDGSGRELWRYESVHGSTAGAAADVDRDGKTEVIAGTEYYWWHCIRPDGGRRWSYSSPSGPRVNAVAVGNLVGDEKLEVVFGSADTHVHALDSNGKVLWKFNTGDEVTAVAVCDLDSDGVDEVVAASKSFNVYALKGNGQRIWRVDLGDEVVALAVLKTGKGQPMVAAGTASGRICVMSGTGRAVARYDLTSAVLALVPADVDGDGRDELVASCGDGGAYALGLGQVLP